MCRALRLLPVFLLLSAATASAQLPTINNITPDYGGLGPNATGPTITGSGFSTQPKLTRFVDPVGRDILTGVSCSSSTECTASWGFFPLNPGIGATFDVYALVNGVKSASGVTVRYYAPPRIDVLFPGAGPYDAPTPYIIGGGIFTSAASGFFPGTTSIYLANSLAELTSGCGSFGTCEQTAPALTYDCCVAQGAKVLEIRTPGGVTSTHFIYGPGGQTPATPTITSISAPSGPVAGGNTVTITGTSFITGTNVPIGGFGILRGTNFAFITAAGSVPATGVNCLSTTTCTLVVPGGTPGPADIQVYTVCGAGLAPCSGNARPSVSVPTTKKNLYAYPGLNISPTGSGVASPVVVSENGHAAFYKVALHTRPAAPVHITLTPTGGGTVSPTSLDFTPNDWGSPRIVQITGTDDAGAVGDTSFNVDHAASSSDSNYNGVVGAQAFERIDNDAKRFYVGPRNNLIITRGGGTASFDVVLLQAPSAQVVVKVTSSDFFAAPVSVSQLVFDTAPGGATGWNVARTVTVTGQNDFMPGVRRTYRIILTSTSADAAYDNSSNLPDVAVVGVDAPVAPTGLSLTRTGPTTAIASWSAVAGATSYSIRYSTTPGGSTVPIASSSMLSQIITGLTAGQQYYFTVASANEWGESVASAEVPFIVLPPAPVGAFGSGDARSEMTYVKANGEWKILNSVGGFTTGTTVTLGGAGYTNVPGDYDGDGRQDVGVYNDATGMWGILKSSTNFTTAFNIMWGGAAYRPAPGDYDGDGKTDPAFYRPSDGMWSFLPSSADYLVSTSVPWGGAGYTPVPGHDFDGDGKADIAVYRQSTSSWYIRKSSTDYTTTINQAWGGIGYMLVPGDYDGDGKTDLGLYRRSTGVWSVLLSGANYTTALSKPWGGIGYLPVPADFDGDGKIDLGAFQQSSGNWYALLSGTNFTSTVSATAWGTAADRILSAAIVVPGDDATRATDFDGDGEADITVYNPTTGGWHSLLSAGNFLGAMNGSYGSGGSYTAVPGDYDGDGRADRGVYQSATGLWTIALSNANFTTVLNKTVGGPAWMPMPGDYDFDGKTDPVVYNQATGQWFGLKSSTNYTTTVNVMYGGAGYTPVTGDFDGDGKTDLGVYQNASGDWSILLAAANYTTSLNRNVGGPLYVPVPGDYDADGKTDFVVYRSSTGLWYGLLSSTAYTTTVNVTWGGAGYTPVKGDYDSDGKADLALYQASSGTWFILLSSVNYTTSLSRALGGVAYLPLSRYP